MPTDRIHSDRDPADARSVTDTWVTADGGPYAGRRFTADEWLSLAATGALRGYTDTGHTHANGIDRGYLMRYESGCARDLDRDLTESVPRDLRRATSHHHATRAAHAAAAAHDGHVQVDDDADDLGA